MLGIAGENALWTWTTLGVSGIKLCSIIDSALTEFALNEAIATAVRIIGVKYLPTLICERFDAFVRNPRAFKYPPS